MTNVVARSLRVCLTLMLIAVMTTGCFFGEVLDVTVFERDGSPAISISTSSSWLPCLPNEDSGLFSCTYFGEDGISEFGISWLGLLLELLIFDPLVLQVPEGASNFQASYFEQGGAGGAMVVTAGLDSIRVDSTRTLQAEPGTQLVIVDFPSDAPPSGSGGFNLNFQIPEGLETLNIKAVFTGKVMLDGETYYVPLYPCTTDMSALPTLNVPLPSGGEVTLPVDSVEGCDGEVYSYGPNENEFTTTLHLPRLGK